MNTILLKEVYIFTSLNQHDEVDDNEYPMFGTWLSSINKTVIDFLTKKELGVQFHFYYEW